MGIVTPSSKYGVAGVIGIVMGAAASHSASAFCAAAAATSSAVTVPLGPEVDSCHFSRPASRINRCTVGLALTDSTAIRKEQTYSHTWQKEVERLGHDVGTTSAREQMATRATPGRSDGAWRDVLGGALIERRWCRSIGDRGKTIPPSRLSEPLVVSCREMLCADAACVCPWQLMKEQYLP